MSNTYSPLAHDTAGNGEWDEWVAALYEWNAADNENAAGGVFPWFEHYVETAFNLADRIEDETYEKIMNEEEWEPFNPDATHPY